MPARTARFPEICKSAWQKKLAERYGDNKNIVCWHISNEYGGECYCENCAKAFRVWLKDKYKNTR